MRVALSPISSARVRVLIAEKKHTTIDENDFLRALGGDAGVATPVEDESIYDYASYARMTGIDVDDVDATPADPDDEAYQVWARESGISS